ncbi:hypothetical protein MNBD_GAMMA08-1596 [hydrothermal vent metagenome]|uniref:Inner membrane protein YjeT (Clustered with HflC) n=1 Tax=hydrothermal vent metagenome TaxID=652676 RepID=A0A3B0WYA6_9ZZZZ
MIAWIDLFSALTLVLIIEGLVIFASPKGWRQTVLQASKLEDKTLRIAGLVSMLVGAILLYLVR